MAQRNEDGRDFQGHKLPDSEKRPTSLQIEEVLYVEDPQTSPKESPKESKKSFDAARQVFATNSSSGGSSPTKSWGKYSVELSSSETPSSGESSPTKSKFELSSSDSFSSRGPSPTKVSTVLPAVVESPTKSESSRSSGAQSPENAKTLVESPSLPVAIPFFSESLTEKVKESPSNQASEISSVEESGHLQSSDSLEKDLVSSPHQEEVSPSTEELSAEAESQPSKEKIVLDSGSSSSSSDTPLENESITQISQADSPSPTPTKELPSTPTFKPRSTSEVEKLTSGSANNLSSAGLLSSESSRSQSPANTPNTSYQVQDSSEDASVGQFSEKVSEQTIEEITANDRGTVVSETASTETSVVSAAQESSPALEEYSSEPRQAEITEPSSPEYFEIAENHLSETSSPAKDLIVEPQSVQEVNAESVALTDSSFTETVKEPSLKSKSPTPPASPILEDPDVSVAPETADDTIPSSIKLSAERKEIKKSVESKPKPQEDSAMLTARPRFPRYTKSWLDESDDDNVSVLSDAPSDASSIDMDWLGQDSDSEEISTPKKTRKPRSSSGVQRSASSAQDMLKMWEKKAQEPTTVKKDSPKAPSGSSIKRVDSVRAAWESNVRDKGSDSPRNGYSSNGHASPRKTPKLQGSFPNSPIRDTSENSISSKESQEEMKDRQEIFDDLRQSGKITGAKALFENLAQSPKKSPLRSPRKRAEPRSEDSSSSSESPQDTRSTNSHFSEEYDEVPRVDNMRAMFEGKSSKASEAKKQKTRLAELVADDEYDVTDVRSIKAKWESMDNLR